MKILRSCMIVFLILALAAPSVGYSQDNDGKTPGTDIDKAATPAFPQNEPPRPGNMQMEHNSPLSPSAAHDAEAVNIPKSTGSSGLEKGVTVKSDKISLDLKGIDILELFRMLSTKMGVTIVPSKSVGGRVNIFLNNVNFKDALDIILISQDLAAERKGNIINIMTAGEYEKTYGKKYNEQRVVSTIRLNYAKPSTIFNVLGQIKSDIGKIIVDESTGTIVVIDIPAKQELIKETVKELDQPLRTEVFDLKYAKSADIKTQLASVITTGPGELFVDERSSKVAISDLPEKMVKIKKILKAFDSAPQEVFIEAEVVELTLNKEFDRGINWQKAFNDEQWIKWLKLTGLSLAGNYVSAATALSSASQQINVGVLTSGNKYNALIKFLQTYGTTKILSRPRIAAINNQEAKVLVGTREAYVTATQSQGQATTVTSESIQFIDVGVKLNVVPTINTDGYITMKIKPEISSVSSTLTTKAGSVVPIVSTSEAETVVKVKDGTMIMIAGLMKEEKTDNTAGLPVVSKIPWLGALFSNRSVETTKTELIVFLTPHIITGDAIMPGTEPENTMPADMVDDSLQDYIINRKTDEIGSAEMGINPSDAALARTMKASSSNVEEKMKGLKKY